MHEYSIVQSLVDSVAAAVDAERHRSAFVDRDFIRDELIGQLRRGRLRLRRAEVDERVGHR